jgi:hypothetical protein
MRLNHGESSLNGAWLALVEHANRHPAIKEMNRELWSRLERVHKGRRNVDVLVRGRG